MSGDDRRPVVVAIVCAVVAVLFFATGAALGADGPSGAGQWRARLEKLRIGAPVTADDLLAIGPSCAVAEDRIVLSGSCLLRIEEFGGRFSFRATKNFRAEVVDGPVVARLEIRGAEIVHTVEPGEVVGFAVGRSGGFVRLECPGFDACRLRLE